MLYNWLYSMADQLTALNVFRYITFRTFLSFLTAFLFCWLYGQTYINNLIKKQLGQMVRDDGPQSHKKKQGTPTMGGGLILLAVAVPLLLWIDLMNPLVLASIVITASFGLIGYVDDYLKVSKKKYKGSIR